MYLVACDMSMGGKKRLVSAGRELSQGASFGAEQKANIIVTIVKIMKIFCV